MINNYVCMSSANIKCRSLTKRNKNDNNNSINNRK